MTFTLVTGASENHFKSLCQFLDSVQVHPIFTNVYVYDLGLSLEHANSIKNKYNIIYTIFDYSQHPSYFNITVDAGQYAWKPTIIWEVAQKIKTGILLWCDAGNILNTESHIIKDIVKLQGIFSPSSLDNVLRWTHSGMRHYFNITDNDSILQLPPRNGAILGFDLDNTNVYTLIENFNNLAHIKECIAPEGSSRENHRQDQALFTILYYKYTNNTILHTYFFMYIHCDID